MRNYFIVSVRSPGAFRLRSHRIFGQGRRGDKLQPTVSGDAELPALSVTGRRKLFGRQLRAPRSLGEMTAVQFTAYAHERFGTNADAFLKLYPRCLRWRCGGSATRGVQRRYSSSARRSRCASACSASSQRLRGDRRVDDAVLSRDNPSFYLAGHFLSALSRPHRIVHAGRRRP
jgi:hypothetical protein